METFTLNELKIIIPALVAAVVGFFRIIHVSNQRKYRKKEFNIKLIENYINILKLEKVDEKIRKSTEEMFEYDNDARFFGSYVSRANSAICHNIYERFKGKVSRIEVGRANSYFYDYGYFEVRISIWSTLGALLNYLISSMFFVGSLSVLVWGINDFVTRGASLNVLYTVIGFLSLFALCLFMIAENWNYEAAKKIKRLLQEDDSRTTLLKDSL